jgi:hypothetical protein
MANGGIIAFKKGEEVEDDEKDKDSILKGIKKVSPVRELTDAERNAQREYAEAEANRKLAREDIRDMNQEIRAGVGKVSPVPNASRTTPPPSPSPADAGITAAPNKMLGNVNQLYSDVEAANLEAGRDMQGNKIGAEADPADVAIEEHVASLKKQQLPLQEVMNKSKADLAKSYQKEREDMNLPDPANRERELFEGRKKRGEESEKETARNNLIRFLTKWGTIPGSTMRGLIGAGADLIDKMDVDEKHRQKFLNDMDDIESKINSSEYARRLGDEDRARKEKDEAGKLYHKLAGEITEIRLKEALKDKDVRKAIEVEKYKIKREEAKGPKGEEYMVGVYSRGLTAGNPKKYPPGPETDMLAAEIYQKNKAYGTVTAATIGQTYKPEELDIKKRLADLEAENLKLKKETGAATTDKTVAETNKIIDGQIKAAKRQRREEIAEAEDKGGVAGRRAKEKEIENEVRARNKPAAAPAAPAAAPSVRSAADAILSGGR